MDKKILLQKLEKSFQDMQGLRSQDEIRKWANKVAPILKLINKQYWINFLNFAHRFNLPLSDRTLVPAFNIMKSQLQMATEELKLGIEMEEAISEQMYFPPDSFLDIQKSIARIIRQAQRSLYIIDPYMDEKIVEELTDVTAAEIRLLTAKLKQLFYQRLEAAKKQFPDKKIEAKITDKSHDRFYIIDQDQVWTLGTSFNQAGGKATLLSKVTNDKEREKIIKDFDTWWQSGNPL